MKIVIIDDENDKVLAIRKRLLSENVNSGDIIEISRRPEGVHLWQDYAYPLIREIKEGGDRVCIFLDWTLYRKEGNEQTTYWVRDLQKNNTLQEGDTVICSSTINSEQFRKMYFLARDSGCTFEHFNENNREVVISGGVNIVCGGSRMSEIELVKDLIGQEISSERVQNESDLDRGLERE